MIIVVNFIRRGNLVYHEFLDFVKGFQLTPLHLSPSSLMNISADYVCISIILTWPPKLVGRHKVKIDCIKIVHEGNTQLKVTLFYKIL